MSKRTTNHSLDERLTAIERIKQHKYSINSVAQSYKISENTLKEWIRKYRARGIDGLKESKTWTRYSEESRENAGGYYLQEKGSLSETCENLVFPLHRFYVNG